MTNTRLSRRSRLRLRLGPRRAEGVQMTAESTLGMRFSPRRRHPDPSGRPQNPLICDRWLIAGFDPI